MFTADYAEILRLMQNVIRHSKQDSTPKHNAANAALLQATMQIILITLFQQTAAVAEDATHRYAANILNACNYIDAHFRENIDIHKIAAAAMLSPSFTYVEFKKETGQTPHEYLIAKRMRAVCSALMFTNKSVFEIALECGFQNPNYLYHLFQKTYQTTPGKFRERFRKSL